ncbi:MAG: type II toxin-antitoxin system RelB/DinJ family antitoxin [Lachnospiraceae bacterium]|jgi:DNA-damage-inducible protein J|nr:type II toxin-antitoxin system RelB/DinJ family antitoxin [Lachnospiraceae bacterium]
MPNTANIHVRIDPLKKAQAVELFDSLGLSISAAFNLFINQAIRTKSIPFAIDTPELFAPKDSDDDPLPERFTNLDDLFKDLKS